MQEEYAADSIVGGQLEAAIPVRLADLRIAGAAFAVALECMGGPGFNLRVDFLFQLREQPVFQPLVVLESSDLSGLVGAEFFGQRLGVPGLQRHIAAALQKQRGAPQNTEDAEPCAEPGNDQASALAFS